MSRPLVDFSFRGNLPSRDGGNSTALTNSRAELCPADL